MKGYVEWLQLKRMPIGKAVCAAWTVDSSGGHGLPASLALPQGPCMHSAQQEACRTLTSNGECAGGALGGRACIAGHHAQLVLGDALTVQLGGGDHHATAAVDDEVHAGHAHLHAVGHQPVQALVQVDGRHLGEGELE